MSNPKGYVYEIQSIDKELKRLNQHIRNLREQKKRAETDLYNYMDRHNIEQVEGIKIQKIRPKERKKVKPKKQREQDAINHLRRMGFSFPEKFYKELKSVEMETNRLE